MKFAKQLETHSVPEWRKAYINYKGLKKKLKAVEKFRKTHEDTAAIKLDQAILQQLDTDSEAENSADYYDREPWPGVMRQNTSPAILSSDPIRKRPSNLAKDVIRKLSLRFSKDGNEAHRQRYRPMSLHNRASLLDQVLLHASEPERMFFTALDDDLGKISRFYNEKEQEAKTKLQALKMQIKLITDYASQLSDMGPLDMASYEQRFNPLHWFKKSNHHAAASDASRPVHYTAHHMSYNVARSRLKKAITEYYRSLELLKSYKELNFTGFQKILKKFDKTAGWKASTLYMQKLKKFHWVNTEDLEDVIEKTETLFINEFADGRRRRGMAKLRVPEQDETYTSNTWRVGFYLGLVLALLLRVYQIASDQGTPEKLPYMYYNLQIYACIALPILFALGFSVNLLVWTKSRINYKFIFELNPRDNLDYHEFAELPALMLLIVSFIVYLDFSQTLAPAVPSELCPLFLVILLLAIMLCPFSILYYSSRKWLGVALGRIVLSYCYPVEFRDFFIADELNSLSYSFWTLGYFFCAYWRHWTDLDVQCPVSTMLITPFVASLPPWWRLLQCIRRYQDSRQKVHLVNGVKYTTSILATMITGFRRSYPSGIMDVAWVLSSILNSSYTSIWDIKMDWGLLQPNSQHFLLRDELVFASWTYYAAIPINIMLRFAWTINAAGLRLDGQLLAFISAALEAGRRLQWNFFRLENEHLNNCGNYHAIKEIPLPFVLIDTAKVAHDEEGAIQLPMEPSEAVAIADSMTETPTVTRRNTIQPVSFDDTFYGRRDFENKHDQEEATLDNIRKPLGRQPSALGNVLEQIRYLTETERSDTEPDHDIHELAEEDDDDDDDDEDSEEDIHAK